MPTFRDGQVNIAALTNPGVYVDIIPPTPFITGVPTNIEGVVGVGQWGPVGTPTAFSSPDGCSAIYGVPSLRTYDLPTHVWAAAQVGNAVNFMGVRVTDGTDVAASAVVQSTGGTATGKYTGTRGNLITMSFASSTQAGAFSALISFPGRQAERFDNLTNGLLNATVTAGSGYTAIPGVGITAPQATVNAIQATATVDLKLAAAPTVVGGGNGFIIGDTVTFTGGIVAQVNTVSGSAVLTYTIAGAGQGRLIGPPGTLVPTGTLTQIATSGVGTGATVTIGAIGLADFTVTNPGQGYTSAPTLTQVPSAFGGSGTLTAATISFWAGLAYAVNNGTAQRGFSNVITFVAGASVAPPTLGTITTLAGGTDGATGVGSAQMLGSDVLPRKGMFALRNTKCDCFDLCDVTDTTTWASQISFAISEAMVAVTATPAGSSLAGSAAIRVNAAVDDPDLWIISGDQPSFFDTQNGMVRLVSPQAYAIGLAGNLSPEQSPINKQLYGVVSTQTTTTGLVIASADETTAEVGGIDVIGRSADLGENYFTFLTGRNSSSNTAANGIEYSRLTNFLARSLEGAATRSIVGQLQGVSPNDPTRAKAKAILDAFMGNLASPSSGSNGYGMIDQWATTCDLTNNPPTLQAQGFLFAYIMVRYLNAVRYFVIKLAGGGNVVVTNQSTPPSPVQFSS